MKKVIAIILAGLVIAGCGRNTIERHDEQRLKCVEQWRDCYILVDKETGVGYLMKSDSGGVAITVMYDADGEIYRPNGWRDVGE